MKIKHKRIILILTIIFVMLLVVSTVHATDNVNDEIVSVDDETNNIMAVDDVISNDVVTVNDNSKILFEGNVGNFNELSTLIENAPEGSTLELNKSYQYVSGSKNGIQINKEITIDGKGHTLDGNKLSRIFYINTKVTLKNINLINAKISFSSSSPSDTYGNIYGGAIYCAKGNLSLINCSLTNNVAEYSNSGWSPFSYGGAIYGYKSICSFVNCSFENNSADFGGAFYSQDEYNFSCTNCSFRKAGICCSDASLINCDFLKSPVSCVNCGSVVNCGFVESRASCSGKGFFENCNFTNSSTTCSLASETTSLTLYGGAISCQNGVSISNCNFENCFVSTSAQRASVNSYGGAVYCRKGNCSLFNCSFNNCYALSSSEFETDSSSSYGGVIYCAGGNCSLFNCSFIDCYTLSLYKNAYSYSYGGAIYLYTNTENEIFNIENCKFINSKSTSRGTGDILKVKSFGGAIYSSTSKLNIINSLFKDCNSNNGGALYLDSQKIQAYDNSLGEYYSYYINSIANIENCDFISNYANVAGAIYENNNGTMIIGCKFINNSAFDESGALYIINDYNLLSDCIFMNNKATNDGAAIIWKGNEGSILSSIFVNNTATKDSGIYIDGGNNVVKDSILISYNQNPMIFSENYAVTANYNWWGNTMHNYSQKPNVATRINVKNWLFLNFTVDKTSLKVGEIATVICDLTHLTTINNVISKYDAFDLPIINLTIISDNNFNTSSNMIGGLGEAQYVATHTPKGLLTIKYNNIEETLYFTIEKGELQLTVSDSAILKGNLLVTAPNNANGIVHIVINDKDYFANMSNGIAKVSIKDLSLGRYLATTSFESDSYIVNTFNSYIDIKSSIDANNLTKNQNSATKFQATFYDFDGNVLKNTKVTFMLNGGLQTATTNNNGVASLDINLSPNTYEITSLNPTTDETRINKIIITASGGSSTDNNDTPGGNSNSTNNNPQSINDNQITISTLDGGSGTVKLPDDATGTITLNVAGKNYNFDVINGVANVKIPELTNGNYGYILTYSGDGRYLSFTRTGSFTVNNPTNGPTQTVDKTTITLKTVKVKKSAKKLILQATLKQGNKALSGKKVTFKFNGKTYKAKTNKNGIAKVTINKNVLKKLKVGKKVKYQASYGKVTAKKTAKVKK